MKKKILHLINEDTKVNEFKENKILFNAIDGYYTLMELLDYDIDLVSKVINYQCLLKKENKLNRNFFKPSRIKCDCEFLRVAKYYEEIKILCDSPHSYLKEIVIKLESKKKTL